MNNIRDARPDNINEIRILLEQLGYPRSIDFLKKKIEAMLADNSYRIIVYELNGKAVAFMTIHYYLQIGFEGWTANIGFFAVDKNLRSEGIGRKMEEYCVQMAKEKGCTMIELFSKENRLDAHRFYERQGYKHYEKFFVKEIG